MVPMQIDVKIHMMTQDVLDDYSNIPIIFSANSIYELSYDNAKDNGNLVAGAIIAFDTEGINMLEGKKDLSVLWDIRVDPKYRGKGLGTSLIDEVKKWSQNNGCTRFKIETQNTNVKACDFYVSQGAVLTGYNKHIYNDYPDEIQFIWSIYL